MKKIAFWVTIIVSVIFLQVGAFAAAYESDSFAVATHGGYSLSAYDSISMDIQWKGNGACLVLLTKQGYSAEEVNELAGSGLLPIGGYENGVQQELAKKYKGIQMLLSVSSDNKLQGPIIVPEAATYYLYVITESDCEEISGAITIGAKQIDL